MIFLSWLRLSTSTVIFLPFLFFIALRTKFFKFELATWLSLIKNSSLKLGICGEHGGDPASIEFCEKTKLNYVSCSPYRVPIARLAAAQAYLKKKK